MDNDLGLNCHHHNIIASYMRFAKYQRGQYLKTVQQSFNNVKLSRLLEETFTSEEVGDILDELCTLLTGDLESDLINMTHTVVLLLCQMCTEAERWFLKLQADISDLENRELLEKVDQFDKNLSSNNFEKVSPGSPFKMTKLEPLIEDAGPHKLLQMEIEKLKNENLKLTDRLKELESRAFGIIGEKSALSEALMEAKNELTELKEQQDDHIKEKLETLECSKYELKEKMEKQTCVQKELEESLIETNQLLLEAQAQLQLTSKELEHRFSETIVYQNLKQMLAVKNDQIKGLRRKLEEYEPVEEES